MGGWVILGPTRGAKPHLAGGLVLLWCYLRSCSGAEAAGMCPGEFWGCAGAGREQDPKHQRGEPALRWHPHTHGCPSLRARTHGPAPTEWRYLYIYRNVHILYISTSVRTPRTPRRAQLRPAPPVGTQGCHAWAPPERHGDLGVSLVPSLSPRPSGAACAGTRVGSEPSLGCSFPCPELPVLGAGSGSPGSEGEKCGERGFSTVMSPQSPLVPWQGPPDEPRRAGLGTGTGTGGVGKRPPKFDGVFLVRGRSARFGWGCPCASQPGTGMCCPHGGIASGAGLAALGWEREKKGTSGAG